MPRFDELFDADNTYMMNTTNQSAELPEHHLLLQTLEGLSRFNVNTMFMVSGNDHD